MLDSEILEQLQGSSVEERIRIIEAILQSLKHDMRLSSPLPKIPSADNPLRGKVIYYENPYEPVATENWEALA